MSLITTTTKALPRYIKVEACSRLLLYLLEKKNKEKSPEVRNAINIYRSVEIVSTAAGNLSLLVKIITIASKYSINCSILYLFLVFLLNSKSTWFLKFLLKSSMYSANKIYANMKNISSNCIEYKKTLENNQLTYYVVKSCNLINCLYLNKNLINPFNSNSLMTYLTNLKYPIYGNYFNNKIYYDKENIDQWKYFQKNNNLKLSDDQNDIFKTDEFDAYFIELSLIKPNNKYFSINEKNNYIEIDLTSNNKYKSISNKNLRFDLFDSVVDDISGKTFNRKLLLENKKNM